MKKAIAASSILSALVAIGCGGSDEPYTPDGKEAPQPAIEFGDDTGALSTSADELLAKPEGNPNPETFVGIYELTGYGSEDRPSEYLLLTNDWRLRREHRKSGIAMALECLIDVGGAAEDTRAMQAFVSSAIEAHDWGVRILQSAEDGGTYTNFDFAVDCKLHIDALDIPYCLTDGSVPDTYSTCVTVSDAVLRFQGKDAGDAGEKIAN
ncbi:MAG: hypothetical protein WKG00_08545 [Polyangiaceae bacterium]